MCNITRQRIYVMLWNHKRHPIAAPCGGTMGYPLWTFWTKLTMLWLDRIVYSDVKIVASHKMFCADGSMQLGNCELRWMVFTRYKQGYVCILLQFCVKIVIWCTVSIQFSHFIATSLALTALLYHLLEKYLEGTFVCWHRRKLNWCALSCVQLHRGQVVELY